MAKQKEQSKKVDEEDDDDDDVIEVDPNTGENKENAQEDSDEVMIMDS